MRNDVGLAGYVDAVGAANGGLDVEMPTGKIMNRKNLLPAVKDGRVSEATIDEKVRRILKTAIRFGWLDRPATDISLSTYNEENHQLTLQAARRRNVLLKNANNLLPLDKQKIKTVLVVGPDAYPGEPGWWRKRPRDAVLEHKRAARNQQLPGADGYGVLRSGSAGRSDSGGRNGVCRRSKRWEAWIET